MAHLSILAAAVFAAATNTASAEEARAETNEDAERAAIQAAIDVMFEGLRERDLDKWSATMRPEGAWFIQRYFDDEITISTTDTAARMAALGDSDTVVDEQVWDPTILIHRDMAVYWAPFEVEADGETVQCGVNSFQMMKDAGAWKVTNISYTAEPCDTFDVPASTD
ncbi:MAG: hypothetical protein AAGJ87_09795 [Pseudomonadota bacterium]